MPNFKPYTGNTKLVIAFDIGTTLSGISYCILERGQVPEILSVTRFPGQELIRADAKVPSILYYDSAGTVKAAGAEAHAENVIESALTEGWVRAEWWKLHLRPNHLASSINKDNDLPLLPPGKSAVHVLTDFIKYLFGCVKTYIQTHHPALAWSNFNQSIEYIFTRPNGWEGVPQKLYRQAIELAGLIPSTPEGRSRVHILSANEACLHFCVANLLDSDTTNQTAPHGVLIIDAGGGMVDLSMYSMTYNPISCEEIAPAECRLQGSVFVTCRARVLLKEKLQGWERSTAHEITEYAREFDYSTKLVIKSDQEPTYIRVAGRRVNVPRWDIAHGKLRLTGEEATGLFTESIDAIIGAFEEQQKSSRMPTVPITTAFLVGGLSTNDWLWSRLQSYFKEKNVNPFRPDNHINKAVANGAVLSHIDRNNHMVASRTARATYGIVCAVPAKGSDEEHKRRRRRWETDLTGVHYVPGYFEAKVIRGSQVREETEFRQSFSRTESNLADFGVQIVRLMCYRGKSPRPEWVDQDQSSFSTLCTIYVDLRQATENLVVNKDFFGKVYYRLDYDVIVYFGSMELRAELDWNSKDGRRQIPGSVSFEDDASDLKEKCSNVSRQPRIKVNHDNPEVLMRHIAPATYGVVCSMSVNVNDEEHIARQHLWEHDPTGDRYVPGRFKTTLRKGSPFHEEMEFRLPFSLVESNPVDFGVQNVRLVRYRGNLSNPRWVDQDQRSFSTYCVIHVDLGETAIKDLIPKKKGSTEVYYQLDYDVIVCFRLAGVQAYLGLKTKDGERRVPATVSYEDGTSL